MSAAVRERAGGCAGFSLVSAIFLLVIVSVAGAFMVRAGGAQQATASFALLAPKAHHAARSGLEWGIYRALNVSGSCPVGSTTTSSLTLGEGGLQGFRVTVDCSSEMHVEAGHAATLFQIVALAERGSFGERDYVSRRLEATVSDAP